MAKISPDDDNTVPDAGEGLPLQVGWFRFFFDPERWVTRSAMQEPSDGSSRHHQLKITEEVRSVVERRTGIDQLKGCSC